MLVLGGYDESLVNFRGPLLRAMVKAGHTVIGVAPTETPGVPQALSEMGVRFVPVALARAGLNPLADLLSLLRLKALFRRERPDVVLSYTIKPVIYGSLAASWSGVPRIYALITGLGAAFHTAGIKGRLLRFIAAQMYRLALKRCTKVLVQNQEIADLFVKEGIVDAWRMMVVPGSGVDTAHFAFIPPRAGPPVFLLLARMLRDKGVEEYVAAARLVKKQLPRARFLLVGNTDPNPAAISKEQLNQWNQEGAVEYRSAVSDVRPLLTDCSIYVLPSYHEGMPRSVLEAMAMGRPVITTNTIGCRDMVFEAGPPDVDGVKWGNNGALVPVREDECLAVAMLRLARDPGLAVRMGQQGRLLAERFFDVNQVNARMMSEMNISAEYSKSRPPVSVA
ncbi:MAG: glycosyltransferase family 4 protein [Opitutae bacterium]|nr:glycosyltransferase family 4 protein [Opitutae bacterium]